MNKDAYVNELNRILKKHDFNLSLTRQDFTFLDEVVMDALGGDRSFSVHLTRAISPPIASGEFYHYSEAVDEILSSQTLRLTSLRKRVGENEIGDFLRDFGFDHPLTIDPATNEPRYYRSIAGEIFYTSFTDASLSGPEEDYFWETFAKKQGARFKFKIELKSGSLRKMVYGDAAKKTAAFFREASDFTQTSLGKVLFWEDAATVCALHLPTSYNIEKEIRLITRRSSLPVATDAGGYEYQEISFGRANPLNLILKLEEIQTDRIVSEPRGARVIRRT